jgi:hypothetical protein
MMWTNKMKSLMCHSFHGGSEPSLGRYAIHRSHGVVACAGTQQQRLNGRLLDYLCVNGPFEGKNMIISTPFLSSSRERHGLRLYVK